MSRSCFNCRFYTGSYYIACGVDPVTAASSPREGCKDWEAEAPQPPQAPQPSQAEQAEPLFNILLLILAVVFAGITITVAVNPAAVIRHAPVVRED